MIKFNINLLLAVLQEQVEKSLPATFELTIRPSESKIFNNLPEEERASYLKYVSSVYVINVDRKASVTNTFYLFVRNSLNKDTRRYTNLSSLELGYIEPHLKTFKSAWKEHFIGDLSKGKIGMLSTLEFDDTATMKQAIMDVKSIFMNALNNVLVDTELPF